MSSAPALPEAERRGVAVRMACKILCSNRVRLLPPDPEALARDMGLMLIPISLAAELTAANPHEFIHRTVGEEAFTLSARHRFYIAYDDTIRSPERIRFSIFHEFGHILLRHFDSWSLTGLTTDQARVLEDEANTFARNLFCPPPVADLIHGDIRDPKWAALFCMSEQAWRVRVQTLSVDRRYIDQALATRVRVQFGDYMFGRRCRECGHVFTDHARAGRCPRCGCRFLIWNPALESREQAAAHTHVAGARAEDLKPRVGEDKALDLSRYWALLRKEK